jgi:thymidylate kinase
MTPTRRIAITGPDGTGKTTLVRRLATRFADRPRELRAFRSPQYHEDPDLPFGALSAAIEDLGQLADRLGDARLKASMLFLAMTLYGDVERHVASTWAPRVLAAERQCLADSLTYARFYLPLLGGPLDEARLAPAIAAAGLDGAWARVEAWLPIVHARLDGVVAPRPAFDLPLLVRALFDRPPADLVPALEAAYQAAIPDAVVLLQATPEALAARLAEKAGAAGGAPRELHEKAQVLAMFQAGLAESAAFLATLRPDLVITRLDTSDLTVEQAEDALLALIDA